MDTQKQAMHTLLFPLAENVFCMLQVLKKVMLSLEGNLVNVSQLLLAYILDYKGLGSMWNLTSSLRFAFYFMSSPWFQMWVWKY
jgi:hypothetical protein